MRCILEIQLFKFTGDEIGVMRAKNPTDRYLEDILPEYCIKPDGKAIVSSGWLQFINEGQEFYYGFNVIGTEGWLSQECEAMGLEYIITEFGIDLSFLKDICRYGYEDTFHRIVGYEQLVFEVGYSSSGTRGFDYEVESEIELIGYLNTDKELVKL